MRCQHLKSRRFQLQKGLTWCFSLVFFLTNCCMVWVFFSREMSGGPEKTLKSPRARERFTWNTGNPGKAGPTFSPGRNSQNVAAWEYSLGPLPGSIPWELVRHADSQAPYQTSWTWLWGWAPAIYGLTGHPGESDPCKSLNSTHPGQQSMRRQRLSCSHPPPPLSIIPN